MERVSYDRLKELNRAEKILRALEGAGVDNWEGYEIAMEDIEKEDEKASLIDNTVQEILEEAAQHIDSDVAGPGTGHGFFDEVQRPLTETLELFIENYNKI